MVSSFITGILACSVICCNSISSVQGGVLSTPKFEDIKAIQGVEREIEFKQDERIGYIFLGDSRTVGMNMACNISGEQDKFVVAKVGQGLSWYKSTAKSEIDRIISSHDEIDSWVVISNLGVNDLYNINNYIDMYENLQDSDFDLYLVSVNPVCGGYSSMTSEIQKFNSKLSGVVDEEHWINTYDVLINKGFSSSDGLHYGVSTYELIYDIIKEGL